MVVNLLLYTAIFLLLFLLFCNSNFKQGSLVILFVLTLRVTFLSAHSCPPESTEQDLETGLPFYAV